MHVRYSVSVILLVVSLTAISSAVQQVYYVLPDNSSSDSCPLQPCATLSQLLLDNNGSLPVLSNVVYHLLPGDHHVPTNMTLQYLYNVTIRGDSDNKLSSTAMFIDLLAYVKICNSMKFTFSNLVFKTYDKIYKDNEYGTCRVILNNCFSCKIVRVTFLDYGICGENLKGRLYLSDLVMDFTLHCYDGIYLNYEAGMQNDNHTVIINRISMFGNSYCIYNRISALKPPFGIRPGIHIRLSHKVISMTFIIRNSHFQSMGHRIISIKGGMCSTHNSIWIEMCIFEYSRYIENNEFYNQMIEIELSHFNTSLNLLNCQFFMNEVVSLISVKVSNYKQCDIPVKNKSCSFQSNVSIINITFIANEGKLLRLYSEELPPCKSSIYVENIYMDFNSNYNYKNDIVLYIENLKVYVNKHLNMSCNQGNTLLSFQSSLVSFYGLLNISGNVIADDFIMIFQSSIVQFNGAVKFFYNSVSTVMTCQSSDVQFNGPMLISNNEASVMHMYSSNITFNGSVNIFNNGYNLCEYIIYFISCKIIFSKDIFITSNVCNRIIIYKSQRESAFIKVMEYSSITFSRNNCSNLIAIEIDPIYSNPYPFCLFQYVALHNTTVIPPSHYSIIISDDLQNKCELSFYHFIFYCKWISTSVFNGYKPREINKQIIQLRHEILHSTIFYCSDFSINALGPLYPGQKLQVEFCIPCSNNNSVFYAETHSTFLPSSACKIVDQSELVNFFSNNSKLISYTIVSEDNDSCELFLTVSPYLYYIYEVFDVQLLPCPIGFTLQNGVCDCDPLLPTIIDTCYIDQSAVRRPMNAWVTYVQSDTSRYLISDCPMDYCLPFSSNVNLLYPDTQCQFNRTGILCSQCQHHLSMVFGSSRCMKCTNVHILITIIVLVAGIALVVLLYLLNLTVTKATISGIILYANIISINDSVFLVNDNVFNPLRVFISFLNLDLGIEVCFYNEMDGYVKVWLQLFFPIYLIIIAFSIIIASRYSLRILRLTYSRSLPVLSTLFLLSYTSVLRTVLTVLFSYTTMTHVPSGQQDLVWSIDASVSLFVLKFTILFTMCIILFLIMLFFNIILLFTRYLLQFKAINRFKPILDAFQGSYKDRYYYWVAVHILLRSLCFVLYAFQINVRLVIATIILVIYTSSFGYIRPNKNKLANLQELLLLANLTIIQVASIQSSDFIFYIVTNLMIGLAFVQLCFIVLFHFLAYTCHFNMENTLWTIKKKLTKCPNKHHHSINTALLNIPECTYNYSQYQDGLVSDDFATNGL